MGPMLNKHLSVSPYMRQTMARQNIALIQKWIRDAKETAVTWTLVKGDILVWHMPIRCAIVSRSQILSFLGNRIMEPCSALQGTNEEAALRNARDELPM